MLDNLEGAPTIGSLARERCGIVRGSVVHEHDLAVEVVALERILELPHQVRDARGFVECGDEHGEVALRHTRFRMRAGKTPSWSRYFATVRRAIFTPSAMSSFTIA